MGDWGLLTGGLHGRLVGGLHGRMRAIYRLSGVGGAKVVARQIYVHACIEQSHTGIHPQMRTSIWGRNC